MATGEMALSTERLVLGPWNRERRPAGHGDLRARRGDAMAHASPMKPIHDEGSDAGNH